MSEASGTMDDLYNLELLSLVAKITQEIENHTALNDKTLAEFVINLHEDSKSLSEFKQKLKNMGADFPDSFVENMDRLILNMHPKHKKKSSSSSSSVPVSTNAIGETEKRKRMFPGLSKPDQDWEPSQMNKDAVLKEVDDMMAQLEGMAGRGRPRRDESEDEPSAKRPRRHGPRSLSPPRGRTSGPPRDRTNGQSRRALDERPVLFKIYDGKVAGLKEFGAFVQLDGVAGRVEGELQIDTITSTVS
jgi:ATP-dependent RNA helicase DHX8/PRP22